MRIEAEGWLIGVDEVGRGSLAGPVVAACIAVQDPGLVQHCRDSKCLSLAQRLTQCQALESCGVAISLGWASAQEIDQSNIHRATLLAMQRAIAAQCLPQGIIVDVDGIHAPQSEHVIHTHIKGDQCLPHISAASIVAKVWRDRLMQGYEQRYPGYGFACHVGYPTAQHRQALQQLGPCAIHRRSFGPVSKVLALRSGNDR